MERKREHNLIIFRAALSFVLAIAVVVSAASMASIFAETNDADERIRIAVIDSGISALAVPQECLLEGKNYAISHLASTDRIGHGSCVASIINERAPDALLIPLVWYDKYPSGITVNGGSTAAALAIMSAVDEYDADIINMSMGSVYDTQVLRNAVDYAVSNGVIVVSAVGNSNLTDSKLCYYPACCDGVIGVGSCRKELVILTGDDYCGASETLASDDVFPVYKSPVYNYSTVSGPETVLTVLSAESEAEVPLSEAVFISDTGISCLYTDEESGIYSSAGQFAVSDFSQRNGVDLLAPGEKLPAKSFRGKTATVTGTSYSCAYVTGVIASLMEQNPDMSSEEITRLLFDSAADIADPAFDSDSGWGCIE